MKTLAQWQEMFDGWAGQDPHVASTGVAIHPDEMAGVALAIADWAQLDGSQQVLDVGCASGTLTSMWAALAERVTGVDFSAPLLVEARRRHAGTNIDFVEAPAAALPFADRSFDVVVCFGLLLCLPDHAYVDRAIDEILRVARPDARIVLGSLPDTARKSVFFDHCDSLSPWYRRMFPRDLRWLAKRVLRPGRPPGETDILWFDPEGLATALRGRGLSVDVENDPEYCDYADYRKTLVLARGRPRDA